MTRYLLKTVDKDGNAYGDFRWPLEPGSIVTCPDWNPAPRCGGGLHGALDGEGDGSLFKWQTDAVWIAAEIPDDAQVVDLGGKVKVDRCVVRCSGDRDVVTAWLRERLPHAAIIGGTATAGYDGTATAGDGGTIVIKWWDGSRYRLAVGYVSEDGIEPNVPYRVDGAGKLVRADGGGA